MAEEQRSKTLEQAAALFLESRRIDQAEAQQELSRFMQWFGRESSMARLTPSEIEEYGGLMAAGGGDMADRLRLLREFLTFTHRQGLAAANLAPHLKASRGVRKAVAAPARRPGEEGPVYLTAQGHAQLQSRLEWLRQELVRAAEEIRKAAADKDVRENAPLEAARQYHGQVASRVREIEAVLAKAKVMEPPEAKASSGLVCRGSRVVLRDVISGEDVSYLLVDPGEASLLDGKISAESPVGRALLERREGEEIQVTAPRGVLHYRIIRVE